MLYLFNYFRKLNVSGIWVNCNLLPLPQEKSLHIHPSSTIKECRFSMQNWVSAKQGADVLPCH